MTSGVVHGRRMKGLADYSPYNQDAVRDAWTAPLKATGILPYDVIAVAVPLALLKMYW